MARPAFGGRRALSRIGQLAAFAGVVMLVAGFLGFLGGASGPVLDAGARTLIDGAGATGSVVRVQTRLGRRAPKIRMPRCSRRSRPRCGELPAIDPAQRGRRVGARHDRRRAGAGAGARGPGLPDAARLVEGEWPTGADEGALQEAAADSLGVGVGDEIVVGDIPVTIVGLWAALDPGEARWFGDPAVGSGRRCRRGRPAPRRRVGARARSRSARSCAGRSCPSDPPSSSRTSATGARRSCASTAELRRIPSTNSALEAIGSLSEHPRAHGPLDEHRGRHHGAAARPAHRRGRGRHHARRARDRRGQSNSCRCRAWFG